MPNTKQAKKRMVTDDRRRMANKAASSAMKTAVKKVVGAESAEAAQEALPNAMRLIDKAAKKNVIHDNTAARKKSQLHRAIVAKKG